MSKQPIPMCLTLVVDDRQQRILLGRKLRGFGQGKVIAPGGKLEPGESAVDAAVRELVEETRLVADRCNVREVGELLFTWADPGRVPFRVSLVVVDQWSGQLGATDELEPFWCPNAQIPYAQMWDDDRIWLPNVLRGNAVTAEIGYDYAGEYVEAVRMNQSRR